MKSAGNDIVALNAIDMVRSNTPAFYSKFVTAHELSIYNGRGYTDFSFSLFLWLLWSVKESVYKYLKRLDTGLVFSPTKTIVQHIIPPTTQHCTTNTAWESDQHTEYFYWGEVIFGTYRLYFRTKITDQYVASLVDNSPGFEGVYWGIHVIEDAANSAQSSMVRQFALSKIQTLTNNNDLQINKTPAGIPVIIDHDKPTDIPISLAHHGHFVSYAFYLAAVNTY